MEESMKGWIMITIMIVIMIMIMIIEMAIETLNSCFESDIR